MENDKTREIKEDGHELTGPYSTDDVEMVPVGQELQVPRDFVL